MKSLFALSALLLSNVAFAAPLPVEMRDVFTHALYNRCAAYDLKEGATEFRSEKYDQGLFDHFYTTTFTGKVVITDAPASIVVRGIIDAASGAHEVLEISSDVAGLCR